MSKEGEVNVGIEIVSMLHAGFRCGPSKEEVDQAQEFYGGLLGLEIDQKRPEILAFQGSGQISSLATGPSSFM